MQKERKVANAEQKKLTRLPKSKQNQNLFRIQEFPQKLIDKVLCQDSLEALRKMPDNCVDVFFTSPPYNFGLHYGDKVYSDTEKWDAYFAWIDEFWKEMYRVLKPSGRVIINVMPMLSDYVPTHKIYSRQLEDWGFLWKVDILWMKNNFSGRLSSWGSWLKPSAPYFKSPWEYVLVYCKGSLKKEGIHAWDAQDDGSHDISPEDFKNWVKNAAWNIAPERNMKKFNHPGMMPLELAVRCIKLFSFRGDVIVDPFGGAGTTAVACRGLKRHFVSFDIDAGYCKTTKERLLKMKVGGLL